jgi:hypothetical protein
MEGCLPVAGEPDTNRSWSRLGSLPNAGRLRAKMINGIIASTKPKIARQ